METDFSKEILEKIKTEQIKPKSKWHFMLKDYEVWFVFALSIIMGSLAFAVILHFLEINDWDAYYRVSENFLAFVLLTMPYFWLVFFLVFLYVAYYNLKNTKAGYRYDFAKVVTLNILLSIFFGSVLYSVGVGRQFENEFALHAPFYKDLRDRQEFVWFNPAQGVLVGRVVNINEATEVFELDDPHREIWTVDVSGADYPEGFMIQRGFMIKVFGKKGEGHLFVAEEIRPLIRERGPMPRVPGVKNPSLIEIPLSVGE